MKYYTFTTEEEAIQYNSDVTTKKNYNGSTNNWADVVKHPVQQKWAVPFNYILELENKEPIELTQDWIEI